ncbi:J domain-containing protein [bacterium]|nr:J domain-containing protein [bacterium]
MNVKDYYKILGVQENATAQQIKSAYRNLAKKYHPDANPDNKQAEETFKAVSEAYDVLGSPGKKAKYDQMRKYGFNSGGFNPGDFDFGSFHRAGRTRGPGGFTFEGFDVFGDIGQIFSQFFGGAGPFQETRRKPQTGADLHVEVQIPFEKALHGGNVDLKVRKNDICPDCEGGGAKPGSTVKSCPTCHGRGTAMGAQSLFGASRQPCPSCYGKGQIIENPCNRCSGKGIAPVRKTYSIRIPAGVGDGEQIRLKGEGQKDPAGLPPGNLYIKVKVKSHRFFKRHNRDIHCEVEISDSQASQGTQIKIKTVHGDQVKLKIPPGTADGTVLRIPRMGIDKDGGRGDQLVKVVISKTRKQAG